MGDSKDNLGSYKSFADTLDPKRGQRYVTPPSGSVYKVNPDGSLDLHIWAGIPFPFAKCPSLGGCPQTEGKKPPPLKDDDSGKEIDNSRKTIHDRRVPLDKRIEELNIIARLIHDFSRTRLRETLPDQYKHVSALRDDFKLVIHDLLNEGMAARTPFDRYNALAGVNRTFEASKFLGVFPESTRLSDIGINAQILNNTLLLSASDLVPQVVDTLRTPFITKNERDYNIKVLEHAANTLGNLAPHRRDEMDSLLKEFLPVKKGEVPTSEPIANIQVQGAIKPV